MQGKSRHIRSWEHVSVRASLGFGRAMSFSESVCPIGMQCPAHFAVRKNTSQSDQTGRSFLRTALDGRHWRRRHAKRPGATPGEVNCSKRQGLMGTCWRPPCARNSAVGALQYGKLCALISARVQSPGGQTDCKLYTALVRLAKRIKREQAHAWKL